MVNDGALEFNRSDALTVANVISGTGTLTQAGTGTLTLSGTNTYTGDTFINAGTLALDGTIAGDVIVGTGAALAGAGQIEGELTVNGTITAGSTAVPFGTLGTSGSPVAARGASATLDGRVRVGAAAGPMGNPGVSGNLTLAPGARDVVAIDASGNHSLLMTSGAALVHGATLAIDPKAGSYARVTFYPVVYAGSGLTGTMTATTTNAALEPLVTSTANTLVLTVLNTELPLGSFGATSNGAAIGGAFDRLRPHASGDLAVVTRELTALDDAGLGLALDSVAGEIHASGVQLAALDGEANTDFVRRVIASRESIEAALVSPAGSTNTRPWARLQNERTVFANGGAHGAEANLSAFAIGADWTVADRWIVGVGTGYTKGNLALKGLAESSDYTAPRAFGYVGYSTQWWSANLGASLARNAYDVRRTFLFTARLPEAFGGAPIVGGVDRAATSAPTGMATDVWADWTRPIRIGAWKMGPSAGLRYARYARRSWTESGAAALSLSAPDQTALSAQADLGLHVTRGVGRFRPSASATYRRELTDGHVSAKLQLSESADGIFMIDGQRFTRDALTTGAGLRLEMDGFAVSLTYDGRHAASQMRHGINFGVTF